MILGIESSCDESALALLDRSKGIVGEWVSSQVTLHAEYGGVVPELASREHLSNFAPLLRELRKQYSFAEIDEIVVTAGPGLAGCLAMGIAVGNALSISLNIPVYAANHLRAHAHSVFIETHAASPSDFDAELDRMLPHLSLIVSGGNTLLAHIDEDRLIELIGETIDDAAGEALDKGAKLLGLGYPGGPKLEAIARSGNSEAYDFPRALMERANFDFSFSGLKTSLRYLLEGISEAELDRRLPDICSSYQEAVVDALIQKTGKALRNREYRSVGLSGGVSNNGLLRQRFRDLAIGARLTPLLARKEHTGDNAGMIAFSRIFEKSKDLEMKIDIHPGARITHVF
tara:strand:- start:871 stop:1902 length:1032 start_codon:yes stop_codon:yes gene_type:complete